MTDGKLITTAQTLEDGHTVFTVLVAVGPGGAMEEICNTRSLDYAAAVVSTLERFAYECARRSAVLIAEHLHREGV